MTAGQLAKILSTVDPKTLIIIGVEGYWRTDVKAQKPGLKTYRGKDVKYPNSLILKDDAGIEELGIF